LIFDKLIMRRYKKTSW